MLVDNFAIKTIYDFGVNFKKFFEKCWRET